MHHIFWSEAWFLVSDLNFFIEKCLLGANSCAHFRLLYCRYRLFTVRWGWGAGSNTLKLILTVFLVQQKQLTIMSIWVYCCEAPTCKHKPGEAAGLGTRVAGLGAGVAGAGVVGLGAGPGQGRLELGQEQLDLGTWGRGGGNWAWSEDGLRCCGAKARRKP